MSYFMDLEMLACFLPVVLGVISVIIIVFKKFLQSFALFHLKTHKTLLKSHDQYNQSTYTCLHILMSD